MTTSDLDRLIEVKEEILVRYRHRLASGEGVLPENILESSESEPPTSEASEGWVPVAIPEPKQQLAVGVARGAEGNYKLSVRIKRGDGEAYRAANQLQQELTSSEIEVVEDVAAPKRTERTQGRESPSLRRPQRPLHLGLSIGRAGTGAGTLGVFVQLESGEVSESGVGFLSSVSVLAPGEEPETGAHVYQPGWPDAERLVPSNAIGEVRNFVDVVSSYPNKVDVALAVLSSEAASGVQENRIPTGIGCRHEGAVVHQVDTDVFGWAGARVAKIGRTTGYTRGVVSAVSMDGVTVYIGRQKFVFDDLIEIRSDASEGAFSAPGDSGSLVFLEDRDLAAIGLIFAAGTLEGGTVSYACRLDLALQYLGVKLLGS